MEVSDSSTFKFWQVFEVATSITFGVMCAHSSSGVQRLVNVSYVMDNETKGKRLLVLFTTKGSCNLRIVGTCFIISSIHQEIDKVV
jgi:hypothetical protein